ncbi:hypothetical protein ISR92_02845 [Patescibacteria group bacterium]|nr:hypothetical protein [Patescibacteria group bacterium]
MKWIYLFIKVIYSFFMEVVEVCLAFVQMGKLLIKGFAIAMLLIAIGTPGAMLDRKLHEMGRHNATVHEVVLTLDAIAFFSNGGGFYGASQNYYGWCYAKATADENRSLLSRVLFWKNPFYITKPQDEWPYYYQG